jgi:hypothetical protein
MKRLWLLVALVWAPFLSVFVFASLGDTSALHIGSHLLSIALLVAAVLVVRRVLEGTLSRVQRLLARVLATTLTLAVVGNLLELAIAVDRLADDGWANLDTADIWVEGPHVWAANLTVPAMMLSMLAVVALLVAAAVSRRRLEVAA